MIKQIILVAALFVLLVVAAILIMGIFWSRTRHGKLDYKAAIILKLRGVFIGEDRLEPDIMRQESVSRSKSLQQKPGKVAEVKDLTIPGPGGEIPIRLYYPVTCKKLPVFIYYHGGGWVTGDLDTSDTVCRMYANKAGALVIAVHYRRAPEHRFPAALDDCYQALEWVHGNIAGHNGDPLRIAVGGSSAGGNLAAAVALKARDASGPKLVYQALVYPVTDAYHLDTDSYDFFAQGYGMIRDHMVFFCNTYLPEKKDRQHPYASPALADDFSALPPAMVITAGFDVIRDEGIAYAKKLEAAGVETRHVHYDTMIHGFTAMSRLFKEAEDATDKSSAALREAFVIDSVEK